MMFCYIQKCMITHIIGLKGFSQYYKGWATPVFCGDCIGDRGFVCSVVVSIEMKQTGVSLSAHFMYTWSL